MGTKAAVASGDVPLITASRKQHKLRRLRGAASTWNQRQHERFASGRAQVQSFEVVLVCDRISPHVGDDVTRCQAANVADASGFDADNHDPRRSAPVVDVDAEFPSRWCQRRRWPRGGHIPPLR
jgi:hypothetical protein